MKTKGLKTYRKVSILFITLGIIGIIITSVMGSRQPQQTAAEKEIISFALCGDQEMENIAREVAQTFMKQQNCEVEVYAYASEDELNAKIIGQIAAGKGFDVFYTNPYTFRLLAEKGQLLPLDHVVDQRRQEGDVYYPAALQNGMIDGVQYGMPAGVMPYMIYYNASMLEEHGIVSPQTRFEEKTWDFAAFEDCVRTISESLGEPAIGLTSAWWMTEPFIKASGGSYRLTGEGVQMDVQALNTLSAMRNLLAENAAVYYDPEEYDALAEKFAAGELPMYIADLRMTNICSGVSAFQWDIVPFPSPDSNFDNSNFDVPLIAAGKGQHTGLAAEFLDYYVSTLGQKLRLENGECLIPSLNMTFYTSMGDVVFPEHSNYYFFAIENGYSCNNFELSEEQEMQILKSWKTYMGDGL